MSRYKNIIFDVGSVLVNWMRMNLYTTLFLGDREKAKWIIDQVVTNEWNDQNRLGKAYRRMYFRIKTGISQVCSLHWCLLVLLQRHGWRWGSRYIWDIVRFKESRLPSVLSYQLVSWDIPDSKGSPCPFLWHVWRNCSEWGREVGKTESRNLSASSESL